LPLGVEIGWSLVAGVGAAIVTALRCSFMFHSLWAEDGTIFFAQALHRGSVANFGRAYEGYLHTVPRTIAAIAALMPLRDAPAVFGIAVVVVVACVGAVAEHVSGRFIRRRWLRLVCGLSVGLLPVLGAEAIGSAANLQFLLVFMVFWLLLTRSEHVGVIAAICVVEVLVVLTSAVAVVLIPLAVCLWAAARSARTVAIPAALIGAVGTLFVYLAIVRPARGITPQGSLAHRLGQGVVGLMNNVIGNFVPHSPGGRLTATAGRVTHLVTIPVAALVVVALAVGLAALFSGARDDPSGLASHQRAGVAWLVILAVGTWFLIAAIFGNSVSRYGVLPGLFLVAAVCVVADGALDALRARPATPARVAIVALPGVALVMLFVLSAVVAWKPIPYRIDGPEWQPQVQQVVASCKSSVIHPDVFDIAVAPRGFGSVAVTCAEVRTSSASYGSPAPGTSTRVFSIRPVILGKVFAGFELSAVHTNSVRRSSPPSMHA
jgi:hypothetical protein